MHTKSNIVIETHLNQLELRPKKIECHSLKHGGWYFALTPNIQSELYITALTKKFITFQLTTTIDITPHEDTPIYTTLITPSIAPLSVISTVNTCMIRLFIQSSHTELFEALCEGIVLKRHISSAVFTALLSLCDNKIDASKAIQVTLNLLKRTRLPQ